MELKLVSTDMVTIGEIEDIQALDTYHFPYRVFYEYVNHVKHDKFLEYDEVRKKIIRDIIVGEEAPMKSSIYYKIVFYYGNLVIHVNMKEKSICYIKNHKGEEFHSNIGWEYIEKKKSVLNEIMGIR